jgi:hypothetical protein
MQLQHNASCAGMASISSQATVVAPLHPSLPIAQAAVRLGAWAGNRTLATSSWTGLTTNLGTVACPLPAAPPAPEAATPAAREWQPACLGVPALGAVGCSAHLPGCARPPCMLATAAL